MEKKNRKGRKIKKGLKYIFPRYSEDVEEVLKKEIVPIGNGAHVICPKEHIGKLAYLVIVKK
mgnify:CR=1 FL=1